VSAAAIVKNLAAERLNVPVAQLDAANTLREAGIDSLAAIDLVVAIEDRLGIRFGDGDLESMRSFDDVTATIERLLASKHAAP
jgi:acyl carrier protein